MKPSALKPGLRYAPHLRVDPVTVPCFFTRGKTTFQIPGEQMQVLSVLSLRPGGAPTHAWWFSLC